MINIQIYGNANSISRTITVDINADVLATSFTPSNAASSCIDYYIKFTPSAPDTSGIPLPIKYVRGLNAATSSLVLNGVKQKGSNVCSSTACSTNAYNDLTELITDYVYDYIEGHTQNQFNSGCSAKAGMKFSS